MYLVVKLNSFLLTLSIKHCRCFSLNISTLLLLNCVVGSLIGFSLSQDARRHRPAPSNPEPDPIIVRVGDLLVVYISYGPFNQIIFLGFQELSVS